jgi:hypothetical protein
MEAKKLVMDMEAMNPWCNREKKNGKKEGYPGILIWTYWTIS